MKSHGSTALLGAAQEMRDNPGMAAPAGWKPGDVLIKTGKEIVGEY